MFIYEKKMQKLIFLKNHKNGIKKKKHIFCIWLKSMGDWLDIKSQRKDIGKKIQNPKTMKTAKVGFLKICIFQMSFKNAKFLVQ